MKENAVEFEEIHITKREDGKGFNLKAKGIWNNEPCTIEVPMLQQPNISINQQRTDGYLFGKVAYTYCNKMKLEFNADIKPEKEVYYNITIDPVFYAKRQIKKLETELEEIKNETDEKVKDLLDKINELKEVCLVDNEKRISKERRI